MFLTLTPPEQKAVAAVWPQPPPQDMFARAQLLEPGSTFVELSSGLWVPPDKPKSYLWWDGVAAAKAVTAEFDFKPLLQQPPEPVWTFHPISFDAAAYSKKLTEAYTKIFGTYLTAGDELADLFPALRSQEAKCPKCRGKSPEFRLDHLIQHLNDYHAWSRQRIADWLETLDLDLTIQSTSQGD